MKKFLILGAAGFIGGAICKKLMEEGQSVIGVDNQPAIFNESIDIRNIDLRQSQEVYNLLLEQVSLLKKSQRLDIFQFAAEMGGAEYIFSGLNDFEIMSSSVEINVSVATSLRKLKNQGWPIAEQVRLFYSSSACVYPVQLQTDPNTVDLREEYAYPANPDSEYGWEKLFSERLFLNLAKEIGIEVRIARYHNVYGPGGAWTGGREKAPAAICRKVALAEEGASIEIWGSGNQTRSFLFIGDCLEATLLLMNSDLKMPVNIGSERMVSINQLGEIAISAAKKNLTITNVPTHTVGVAGRNSNNTLISSQLGWSPDTSLESGMSKTYAWVAHQASQSLD